MLPIPFGFLGGLVAYLFQDDFNRANSPTVGNGWVEELGSWSIASNQIKKDTSAAGWLARPVSDDAPDDQYAQLVIGSVSISKGPAVRIGDIVSGGDGYYVRIFSSSSIHLARMTDGARTDIGTFNSGSYASGATLKVSAVGSTIKAFDPVTERISVVDANHATGRPGIINTSVATTHTGDDFEAGAA